MLRANLIALLICMAASSAQGQSPPGEPLLQARQLHASAVSADAVAINPFDRFLHMAGAGMLGAGIGTGVFWGGIQLHDERDSDDYEDHYESEDEEAAVLTAVVIVLSPWIGASVGALSASGMRPEQWRKGMLTTMFFGGLGSVGGILIGGGFESPVTVPNVAGFIVGTGIGAAVGAMFVRHHQGGLLQLKDGRWSVGVPDGSATGLSLLQVQF